MKFKYTPLDPHGSQRLFTGRTKIISEIFKNVLEGRSIAIFGERQIGKTLLLLMIRDIVNEKINIQNLIDESLKNNIPQWNSKLENAKAVFINLEKCGSNENTLVDRFGYELEKMNIGFQNEEDIIPSGSFSNSLVALLENLSKSLSEEMRLIILMDEMELFERFQDNQNLCGILRDASNHYENIKFIHTGSYHWEDRIRQLGKGSPWNHLRTIYLGGIDEKDARMYLIKPLAQKFKYEQTNNELTDKIVEWSGCKPLLIQEICHQLYDYKKLPGLLEIETELLECENIKKYIRLSIFEENQLDEDQKKILRFLCHKPLSKVNTISKKLNMEKGFVKRKIEDFDQDHFYTVRQEKQGIRINGKLIERFGKKEPILEKDSIEKNRENIKLKEIILRSLRWLPAFTFLVLSVILFFYTHPKNKTEVFSFSKFQIILEAPVSMEAEEEGNLNFSIQNVSNKPIESMKIIFISTEIDYKCNGNNILSITKLESDETKTFKIKYRVRSMDCSLLESKIGIAGVKKHTPFSIKKRSIPIKKYTGELIPYLSGILGLLLLIVNFKKSSDKGEKK